jgi:hypothetical protein
MSIHSGPKIESKNLVFYLDPWNEKCKVNASSCKELIFQKVGTFVQDAELDENRYVFYQLGDWIEFTSYPEISNNIKTNITLAAWIKPDNISGGARSIIRLRYGNEEKYSLFQNGASIRWESWAINVSPRQDRDFPAGITAGVWNHIAIVLESASISTHTMKAYRNGSFLSQIAFDYELQNTSNNLYIGGGVNGSSVPISQYYGSIGITAIYNKPLTNEEIHGLYTATKSRYLL